jgi:cation transport regulator ChaB
MNELTPIQPASDESRALTPVSRSVQPILSIRLNSIGEIMDFAGAAARSQLVPASYRNKPDDIVIAVMFGAELGLPPVQSVQSIAVINGRPSVWGDAVPGLCYASGKVDDIHEFFEGDEGTDGFTAVCIARRRGASEKIGRFSTRDAKTAGLFGQATHGKYPKRMMMWRARHFALHDAFPDVLRGIGTRELDAEDFATEAPKSWAAPAERPTREQFVKAAEPAARADDGWDDTWFIGTRNKLIGEGNAWEWAKLLFAALKAAPTLRDVLEIGDMPSVQSTRDAAPEDARTKIDTAFNAALARFKDDKPGEKKAEKKAEKPAAAVDKKGIKAAAVDKPPAQPAATNPVAPEELRKAAATYGDTPVNDDRPDWGDADYDAVLIDENGEVVGEGFEDARQFAHEFVKRWIKADDAARALLIEYNGDTIEEARAVPDAAELLRALDEEPTPEEHAAAAFELHAIDVPADRGKPSWPGFVKALKAAMADVPAEHFHDWAVVQRPALESCPMAQRVLCVRALAECSGRLQVGQPDWLATILRAKGVVEVSSAPATSKPAEPATPAPAEAEAVTDPDERWVNARIAELGDMHEREPFDALVGSNAVRTLMARLRREKPALFARADAAFSARHAALPRTGAR